MLMRSTLAAAVLAAFTAACTPPAPQNRPAVSDKTYAVSPDAVTVKGGVLTGALSEMKVVERVEEGSGRIDQAAKLTGKLVLTNASKDQTLRLVGGKFLYLDLQGKPIVLEDNRTAPSIQVGGSGYSANDRLDPGQSSSQTLDAEFPVAALKAKNLKEVRLELSFIPSQFREETLNFAVSIGGQ